MSCVEDLLECVTEVEQAFGSAASPRILDVCRQLTELLVPFKRPKVDEKRSSRKNIEARTDVASEKDDIIDTRSRKSKESEKTSTSTDEVIGGRRTSRRTTRDKVTAPTDSAETKFKKPTASRKSRENAVANDEDLKIKRPGSRQRTSSVRSNGSESKLSVSRASLNDSVVSKKRDRRNKKGETALHAACVKGKLDKIAQLMGDGANPNTKDFAGWTPLHEVVSNGVVEAVELLLDNGAMVNVPGPGNNTPLHEAVKCKNAAVVKLLMSYGADPGMRNSKGMRVLDIADESLIPLLKHRSVRSEPRHGFSIDSNQELKVYPYLKNENSAKFQSLAAKHSNLTVASDLTKDVTFVLMECDDERAPANIASLNAVVLGTPIVRFDWVLQSTNKKLDEVNDHVIKGVGNCATSIIDSHVNNCKMMPRLFDGCHFYFLGLNCVYEISASLKVNKTVLSKMVTDAGGVVLRREPDPEAIPEDEQTVPYHALANGPLANCSHYIIYRLRPELAYNMNHLKSLPVGWLIDCIQNFKLVNP